MNNGVKVSPSILYI